MILLEFLSISLQHAPEHSQTCEDQGPGLSMRINRVYIGIIESKIQ